MAYSLLSAIVTRFDSSPCAADVSATGGLWAFEVPEDKIKLGAANPFAVLWHEGEQPEFFTELDYREEGQIRFEVYSAGLAAGEATAQKIKTAFDLPDTGEGPTSAKLAMPLTDGYFVSCTRTNYLVHKADFRTVAGSPVYQIEIVYRTEIKRSL